MPQSLPHRVLVIASVSTEQDYWRLCGVCPTHHSVVSTVEVVPYVEGAMAKSGRYVLGQWTATQYLALLRRDGVRLFDAAGDRVWTAADLLRWSNERNAPIYA